MNAVYPVACRFFSVPQRLFGSLAALIFIVVVLSPQWRTVLVIVIAGGSQCDDFRLRS
jgi:hypothetical protein